MHELVHGDDRAKRGRLRLAGLEEDDGDPREGTGWVVAHSADLEVGPPLLQRAVVVDEVGLLGLREPMLGEQQADRRERDVDLPVGGLGQRHVGDVELSERARAGERVEIEARRARRVLSSATRRRSRRCRRRSAAPTPPGGRPLWAAARTRRGRRSRRCIGQAVDVARPDVRTTASASMPQPAQPRRALRAPPARPGAASRRQSTRQRRTRFSPRSVQVSRSGSKWPLIAAIGPGDPAGIGREAFLAERLPVVPVGHDHVLAADVPGRKRERRGRCRTRPRAATDARVPPCAGGPRRERRAVAASAAPTALERSSEKEARSRRARTAAGRSAGRSCPRLLRARPAGRRATAARFLRDHAGPLQLGDEHFEVDPRATRDVRGGGEQPERRKAEGRDRAELHRVARRLSLEQLAGVGLAGRRLASTSPNSSITIRSRFFAVAS